MSPVEWYYAKGKRRLGPVTSFELKQLADQEFLSPDDLIWREGMDEWLAADNVRGLFERPVAGEPTETSTETSGETSTKGGPAPTSPLEDTPDRPLPTPALPADVEPEPNDESASTLKETAPVDMAVSSPPEPSSLFGAMGPAAVRPAKPRRSAEETPAAFERSAAAFDRARRQRPARPIDLLLDLARRRFTGHFVRSTATVFAVGGHYGLYAAMVVAPITGVILGLALENLPISLAPAVAGVVILALLQYAADRFLDAVHRLDRATSGRMSSTAMIDCFALFMTFLGVAGLITLAVLAMATEQFLLLLPAVGGFIFCQYAAVIALNPESLNFTIAPQAVAGEEALGVFSFLLKVGLRLTPVAFGTGVVLGTLTLGFCGLQAAAWPEQLDVVLGHTLPAAILVLGVSSISPIAGYLLFLACHLLVDLAQSVLSLKSTSGDDRRDTA